MKKLSILCVALMITVSAHAQDNIPPTIEVSSTTYFVPANFTYSIDLVISREFLYHQYHQSRSLASVQEAYFQQITSLGIDKKEFKEDKIRYLTLDYLRDTREGMLFTFSTTSVKTLEKVLSVKSRGSRISSAIASAILSPEEIREVTTAATEKARRKATMIAETQNRKVGKVLKIVNRGQDRVSNFTQYRKDEYPYSVTVTFELL